MATKKESTFGPNQLDVRVRERFLQNGVLDVKTLEKHLGDFPDVASQVQVIDLAQPVLVGVYVFDDGDDEDDDDEAE